MSYEVSKEKLKALLDTLTTAAKSPKKVSLEALRDAVKVFSAKENLPSPRFLWLVDAFNVTVGFLATTELGGWRLRVTAENHTPEEDDPRYEFTVDAVPKSEVVA